MFAKRLFIGIILVAAPVALAGTPKTLSFTTESDQAKQLVEEITQAIETFQPFPVLQQLGNKIVEADPEFAYGVMISGLFQPTPQAVETLSKAKSLAENATVGEQLYIQGMLHTRQGEIAEAIEVFDKLGRMYPRERRVQMMLGQLHTNQGNLGQAGVHFGRAAALDDSTGRIHAFIGNICLLEGEYGKARVHFDEAEKRAPGAIAFQAHGGRIFSHLYEGNVEAALKAADGYLKAYRKGGGNQNFPEVFIWNLKARIYLEHGRPDEALAAYEQGVKALRETEASVTDQQRQAWEGRYLHGKARVLAKKGRFDEAWTIAEELKQQIDEAGDAGAQFLPAYHYLAGYIRLEEGKAQEAIEHLDQANPQDPFHQALKARAYIKLGQKDEAREIYQSVADFSQNSMERALSYPEAVKALESLG